MARLTFCGWFLCENWGVSPPKENEAGFVFSPQAVLAGIVLSNVLPYLETISSLPNLWRQNQYDCVSGDPRAESGKDRAEGWREGKRTNQRTLAVL